ncbi:hypothetical protein IAS59_000031 [Cryptococcus gattii]
MNKETSKENKQKRGAQPHSSKRNSFISSVFSSIFTSSSTLNWFEPRLTQRSFVAYTFFFDTSTLTWYSIRRHNL